MRPAPLELIKPHSIAEALQAIEHGATPIAGGQSLLQSMRQGNSQPAVLVDIASVVGERIENSGDRVAVGAMVSHAQFITDAVIGAQYPWLIEAAKAIGDVQVRNLGTVVGNICWADPRANMAVAMLATGGEIEIQTGANATDTELIPIDNLFVDFQRTLAEGRLVKSLLIGKLDNASGRYKEFSRQPQDLALVNVCVVKTSSGWRIAVGGLAATPLRLTSIESLVESPRFESSLQALLGEHKLLAPPDNRFGDTAYLCHVAERLILDAVAELTEQQG